MKTNDLKKGDRIQLRNGWYGTIADNKKGDIRMATVEGLYKETGSVYAHDIVWHITKTGVYEDIEHTPKQLKLREAVDRFVS